MIITNELGTPQLNTVHNCDALRLLGNMPSQSVNCIVTSPPYFGLRDYGMAGQIGLEETPAAYVAKLGELFREARRVLRDDGTVWLNLGDSYNNYGTDSLLRAGSSTIGMTEEFAGEYSRKAKIATPGLNRKQLLGIPWRVAFGLQDDGWILRSDIIWHKPNPMPESVTDRPTKAHEYVFLFAKSQRYWYDADAIREPISESMIERWGTTTPKRKNDTHQGFNVSSVQGESTFGINPNGRNKRSVWTITTEPFSGAHFATFPTKLIEPMILAGCPVGGVVFDPFMGSGTTAMVARDNGRNYIGSELNPAYVEIARERLDVPWQPMFAEMLA